MGNMPTLRVSLGSLADIVRINHSKPLRYNNPHGVNYFPTTINTGMGRAAEGIEDRFGIDKCFRVRN